MSLKNVFKRWEFILLVLIVAELAFFGILSPGFLNLGNLLYSTNDFAHVLIVAIPFTLVVITGGIDISVPSTMGLVSIIFGLTWKFAGFPIWLAVIAALATGVLAGAINGLLVANTDINPIVLTLGTQFLYSGLATGLSGSIGASGYNGIGGFPDGFNNLAYGMVAGLPNALVFSLLFAVAIGVFLSKTSTGRSLYLVGVNRNAALFSGIKVKRSTVTTYVLTGLGAAVAGIYLTAYFTSSRSDIGHDALMPILTAVVLGGTDINGGAGTILGTIIAAVLLGYLKQGLMTIGVTSDVSQVMVGIILIVTIVGKVLAGNAALARLNRAALKKIGSS
jgi:AI-2 transport system permease protein